jgi:hypothetical protein
MGSNPGFRGDRPQPWQGHLKTQINLYEPTIHITIQLVPLREQYSSIGKRLLNAAQTGHTEHKKYTSEKNSWC